MQQIFTLSLGDDSLLEMFSTFPDGWPGAGLMLLRAAGGAVLMTQGFTYFGGRESGLLPAIIASAAIVLGLLLLIGFLTRVMALLAAVVGVCGVFASSPSFNSLDAHTAAALSAVIALSLTCLGPGALSLDARLFGRREVIIPPTSSRRQ
jgi:uncharacterized membrane protein YphA (DoxX/SURF4 family)